MQPPKQFLKEMRELLGEEFPAYIESFDQPSAQGIRVNTDKISVEEFKKFTPFQLDPVPWTENGFYVREEDQVTKHPYYFAGLYYVQEPSAMLPAATLRAEPGDCVLDLCAAPGGKATELGGRLHREGLLLANDISHSRAKGLLKNLELAGIGNLMVSSAAPENLRKEYAGFFDKILIDAPCSGEGMFRRDPAMLKSYEEHGPQYYAEIQKQILTSAVPMLKPGGKMVYSTCTFSKLENEDNIEWVLKQFPEMELVPLGETQVLRLFPHRVRGEGHFTALLRKRLPDECADDIFDELLESGTASGKNVRTADISGNGTYQKTTVQKLPKEYQEFADKYLNLTLTGWTVTLIEDRLYAMPEALAVKKKIRYLRTGLLLGELKKKRFEPSQALAMFLKREEAASSISFSAQDERVFRYLKGETVEITEEEEAGLLSWTLVCVDGFPLGWAKLVNGSLRNKYYAGWRMN